MQGVRLLAQCTYMWLEMLFKDMYHGKSEILFSPLMLYFRKACYDLQLHSKIMQ